MSKQFELTRGALTRFVKELDEKTIDAQPQGFNNNIRWHIGHLIVTGEKFLFGYPKHSSHIPESYDALFGMGSKPSEWGSDIPSLEQLIADLQAQTARVNELNPEFFKQNLPFKFPFGNIETYGELFDLMMYHEAEHLGIMKAMKRLV